ncbi:MAG: GGDEF domain-containing protein [Clostridia bacterium]|nr:GGDEF domain-containing protein [Clostridia bacterium]
MKGKVHLIKKIKENGISLRITHIVMTVVIGILTVFLFALTIYSAGVFSELSKATRDYIEMERSAVSLMSASDYLTQEIQRFTITYNTEHIDNYLREVNRDKRREKAIKSLSSLAGDSEALHDLEGAMNESVRLMDSEYYAMLLILEATGNKYRPKELANISLTPENKALSDDAKINLARDMVHNRDYYDKKAMISEGMDDCLAELSEMMDTEQKHTYDMMSSCVNAIRLLGIILLVVVLLGLRLYKKLGTDPIINSIRYIKDDEALPVGGSSEYRYLAETYNKMHAAIKENLSMLNYHASHDKLTGVYNRAGYEIISTSLDLKTTTMILFDVDNFKSINDNYGHIAGDKALKKLAKALIKEFRTKDFVCRLGGDEFVVFAVETDRSIEKTIAKKVDKINNMLLDTYDDLPPVTVSAGCVFGDEGSDAQNMLKHADIALYSVKDSGKKGCSFYKSE